MINDYTDYTRDIENNYTLKIEQQKLRENFKNELTNITTKYLQEFKKIEKEIALKTVADDASISSEASVEKILIDKYNNLLRNFYDCGDENPNCTIKNYINNYNQEIIRLDDNNEIFQDFKKRAQDEINNK